MLADLIRKPLSDIFEKSQRAGDASGLEEKQHQSSLQKGGTEGPRELQVTQPHLNPWKVDGTAHCGCLFYVRGQKRMFSG